MNGTLSAYDFQKTKHINTEICLQSKGKNNYRESSLHLNITHILLC